LRTKFFAFPAKPHQENVYRDLIPNQFFDLFGSGSSGLGECTFSLNEGVAAVQEKRFGGGIQRIQRFDPMIPRAAPYY